MHEHTSNPSNVHLPTPLIGSDDAQDTVERQISFALMGFFSTTSKVHSEDPWGVCLVQ